MPFDTVEDTVENPRMDLMVALCDVHTTWNETPHHAVSEERPVTVP